jgi:hypothetical protein
VAAAAQWPLRRARRPFAVSVEYKYQPKAAPVSGSNSNGHLPASVLKEVDAAAARSASGAKLNPRFVVAERVEFAADSERYVNSLNMWTFAPPPSLGWSGALHAESVIWAATVAAGFVCVRVCVHLIKKTASRE